MCNPPFVLIKKEVFITQKIKTYLPKYRMNCFSQEDNETDLLVSQKVVISTLIRTLILQVQIKDNMAMEDMAMSPVNPGSNSNSGIVTIANDATSNDSLRGRPPDGSVNPAPAAGGGGPVNANSQPVRSSSSSQPCIFCWCCCCSCSW